MTVLEPHTYEATVERVVQETPDVRTFRLRLPDEPPFSFLPGQWAMLAEPEAPKVRRAYSISSSPLEKGYVEFSMNAVGEFSTKLFAEPPGRKLLLTGPYGKWYYTEDVEHAVLISGGTGITPFRSILRYVAGKRSRNRITILYSAQTPSRIIYREELEKLASQADAKLVFTITLPDQLAPGERWDGPTGRLTIDAVKDAVPDLGEAVFFLCGPNALVDDISRGLLKAGVPRERIRREHWGDFKE